MKCQLEEHEIYRHESPPVREEWVEIATAEEHVMKMLMSPPVREEWVEIA